MNQENPSRPSRGRKASPSAFTKAVNAPSSPGGLRGVFASPAYRRLWAARTVSQWGDVFATVALALLVLRLTGSALGVSGVVLAEIVPVLLLAPLAGTLVDRLPRVRVMVAADLFRAALAAVLPLLDGHVSAVYTVAFALAAGNVLFSPAAGSALPTLVDDAQLVPANSGIWTAAVLSQIVLAPLAGLVFVAFGPGLAFELNAASFLASAALLSGLRLPAVPASTGRRGWFAGAAAGIQVVTGDRLLRALATGQLLAALSAGATSALLVVLARDQLHLRPSGYGLLLAAIGIGAAAGPLLLTRLTRLAGDPRRPAFVFGPYLLRGGVDLTLASFDLIWQLGRLASLLVGGVTADTFGIRAVYYLGGVLLLLAAAAGWAGMRNPPATGR